MVQAPGSAKAANLAQIKMLVKEASEEDKRKKKVFVVAAAVVLILLIGSVLVYLPTLVPAPLPDPCSNGVQDVSEVGIDCGGTCFKQCLDDFENDDSRFLLFSSAIDVAVDDKDRIYVVDSKKNRVLIYSPELEYLANLGATGYTAKGNTNADFINPRSVLVLEDKIYVGDRFNLRIQAFGRNLEFDSTISKSDYDLHSNLEGIAVFDGKLAIAGFPGDIVDVIEVGAPSESWEITGVNKPEDVFYSAGKIYVADSGNNKIKVFDMAGNLEQELGGLGNTKVTFRDPAAIAVRGGRIAVADRGNNRVQVFDLSLGHLATISHEFDAPASVDIDSKGRFIVADTGNNKIVIFDSQFNFVKELEGLAISQYANYYFSPRYMAIGSDGTIFVSEEERSQIMLLDSAGKYIGEIEDASGYKFDLPRDLVIDSRGWVFIADKANHAVAIFNDKGEFVYEIGGTKGAGDYEFNSPRDVALDSEGRIFVTDRQNSRVQVFDSSYNYLATIEGNEQFEFKELSAVTVDSEDNIYVADSKSSNIHLFNKELEFVRDIDAGSDIVEMEGGIEIDSKGRIIVSDMEDHKVRMLDPETGENIKTIGSFGWEGDYKFNWPHGLAIASNGDIYVVDKVNRRLQVYDSELNYKSTISGGEDWDITTPQ
ncbi:MAG: NHL repeat-containing protein [archaeon]|jgi:DNA-binding beta-propeller fold protein YncE|nr:NHL repeat-containing protein [archaeon]